MPTFIVVWLGQFVSLVGSGLTGFALGVWIFERTSSATQFALTGLCAVLPRLLLSPFAGAIVDRYDRRWVMILCDVGAGLTTLALALILSANRLEVWHIYALTGTNAAFSTFQWPAYAASTSLLAPARNLGRANGMVQLGQAASEILAPALAGALIRIIQLRGVVLVDVTTCIFAVATLLCVRFPRVAGGMASAVPKEAFWRHLGDGWKYIAARPGLAGLLVFFAVVNFIWGMVGALITPMLLSWTTSDILGLIISIAGAGMLAGSLVMSAWGGPQPRIRGVFDFELVSGVCFILIGIRPSFWPVALGAFGAHATIAIVYGSNQAIWQSKVDPGIQGRVFAAQQMIVRAVSPLAYILAGPLADRVFEPLMAAQAPFATGMGQILGIGPGRGIGLMFVLMGVAKIAITLVGKANLRIGKIEKELPDATSSPELRNFYLV